MSWKDMMRRVLPIIDGALPDITSRYGEVEGRPENSSKPHCGVDFNYRGVARLNRSNPAMRAPVTEPKDILTSAQSRSAIAEPCDTLASRTQATTLQSYGSSCYLPSLCGALLAISALRLFAAIFDGPARVH